MLSKKQRQRELFCAEDISLLSILSPPSYAPLMNKLPYLQSQPDSSRVLPFKTEVSLTSTLAFLSGISDDPSHVVAVCVEELVARKGIHVKVAINKERPGSAEAVLETIKDGLQRILKCLSCIPNDSDNHIHDQVLTTILDMSQPRLLARLGVQRAGVKKNTKDRSFFGSPIQQIIEAVGRHKYTKKLEAEARSFMRAAGELVGLLEELKTCKITVLTDWLKHVAHTSSQLTENTKFERLFSGLDINPTTATGFVTRLSKIARYHESSRFLVELAKRSRLFAYTEVTTITLDLEAFLRNPNTETIHKLSECLSRCHTGTSLPLNVNKICQQVKMDSTTAESAFKKATKKILAESKVHAEVQIVAYYELHPVPCKPRVICSNKDACYLCNLFIQVHGMYYVPKSHGRLYTGWRVPPIPSLSNAHTQLDKALQNQIRTVVQEFKNFPDRERVLDLNQNESTILPFSTLMSSLKGIVPPVVEPSRAGLIQKPLRTSQRPQEQPLNLLPEQPTAASRSSESHISQMSNSRIDSRDEMILDQQPTLESASTTSKSSSVPVFSPISLPAPAEPTPTALETPSISDKGSPALSNGNCQLVDQLKEPSITKQDSSQMSAGESAQNLNRAVPAPLRPEQKVNKGKHRVEESRSSISDPKPKESIKSPPSHVEDPLKLTAANLKLFNQSQEFPKQLGNQKLSNPASQTSTELAEASPPEAKKPTSRGGERSVACERETRRLRTCNQAPATASESEHMRAESTEHGGKRLLRRGKTTRVRMDESGALPPPVYTTGRLDIFLDVVFSGIEGRMRQPKTVVGVNLTWLDEKDLKGGESVRERNYHCLEGLERGVEVDGGSGEVVYLERGGEVVVVNVVREGRRKGFGKGG